MALGKYARVEGRRSSSSYCATVTLVVFVALCLAGVWMMTSSSVVPVQKVNNFSEDNKNGPREVVIEKNDDKKQFEDSPGESSKDVTMKGDKNMSVSETERKSSDEGETGDNSEKSIESSMDEDQEKKAVDEVVDTRNKDGEQQNKSVSEDVDKGNNSEDASKIEMDNAETKSVEQVESKGDSGESEKKSDSDESEQNSNETIDDVKEGDGGKKPVEGELFPSGAQSELLNETTTQNVSWSTQAAESKNEKDLQLSSESKQESEHSWKICNVTAGPDYIPCLDNVKAIKKLKSTKHYEHRERLCSRESPTCLVAIPDRYQRPIPWPASREKIWYHNVPHTRLAEYKGHQNWVKVSGEFITFPGGGTQFQHGALHYIEFIEKTVSEVKWGKRSRVVLDVGCGVASFGGYLFDKDVLTMSFAPKDEHEAQVQFALERGIPAISAVMGTQRLPFPAMVFDVVHCARCRVPWHSDGGRLLLELNRLLRPGGFFVWSANPVYQKLDEDVEIWVAMTKLTKSLCWELVSIDKDKINKVGVAIYRKPSSNECYLKRSQSEPPFCQEYDDPNAAWGVRLQSCLHKVPEVSEARGSKWPEQWPARLENAPYWLSNSQIGVYGKPAPEDFESDYEHWKRVVKKSYLNGMGIRWSSVRNVMDMRAVYGGFAAALRDLNVWVMNVVSVESPDTLPIIYERGLFGIYHDWCESFSTYPRTYDLLHADHLFSMVKKKCNVVGLVAEVDRMVRPEGKIIVRDRVAMISELEKLFRSMHWEIRLTYSKNGEGLLCAQKGLWRPNEVETLI